MKMTMKVRKKIAEFIGRAWSDEAFNGRLRADPATILKENGVEIPEGITVRFVEPQDREILVPLPPKPVGELLDDDLEQVAGGVTATIKTPGVY